MWFFAEVISNQDEIHKSVHGCPFCDTWCLPTAGCSVISRVF